MCELLLETDFPLMVPPNPPLAVHRLLPRGQEQGRSGSLRAAYSCEEELLPRSRGEERRRGGGEEEHRRLKGEEERVLPSSSGCSSEGSEYQTSSLRSQGPAYRPPRIRSNWRMVDWQTGRLADWHICRLAVVDWSFFRQSDCETGPV